MVCPTLTGWNSSRLTAVCTGNAGGVAGLPSPESGSLPAGSYGENLLAGFFRKVGQIEFLVAVD